MARQLDDKPIFRKYGNYEMEIVSPQQARDMEKNRALPLSNSEREDLRRVADQLEERENK